MFSEIYKALIDSTFIGSQTYNKIDVPNEHDSQNYSHSSYVASNAANSVQASESQNDYDWLSSMSLAEELSSQLEAESRRYAAKI